MSKIVPFKVPEKRGRPDHVAIIMDGNGRWAKERGLRRIEGHVQGAKVVRDITTFARELEIRHLTLYSFSVQNWRRPPGEIAALMRLLEDYCRDERDTLLDNDIRLTTIGRLDRIPRSTRRRIEALMAETAGNRSMTLTLAVDYGGREELTQAMRALARDVKAGVLRAEDIDEDQVSARLDTGPSPDPDLVIRTSGEKRVSNFLLWQIAYSEFCFSDVRWPDFTRADFAAALRVYAGRERRFGATSEQVIPLRPRRLAVVRREQDAPVLLKKDRSPC